LEPHFTTVPAINLLGFRARTASLDKIKSAKASLADDGGALPEPQHSAVIKPASDYVSATITSAEPPLRAVEI
jgi:hypothetical protein